MSTEFSIKATRDRFKSKGIFYTPPELAEYMRKLLPDNVTEVYDPTVGGGNLLAVFPDNVKKYGQELGHEQFLECCAKLTNFEGYEGNTLTEDHFAGRKFQAIMANPPFSVAWEPFKDPRFDGPEALAPKSKSDYAFIMHCLYHLADDGKAIILEFPGILYRGQAEGKIRRWLVEQNYIEQVISIPGKKFTDTDIATIILVLSKCKTSTAIAMKSWTWSAWWSCRK